ncbi:tumor protein p63-regulated gene 1 protein isoform X2 [Gouania willdenowi]|uniref:tumor protein p63-regulated gene 1 protein isoform X2 n=1 Tax=Gouania willdenowi TaxID=441366 RepID=UPI001054B830|nr:tumor protein p63-regulated gene 1 protein-like isoform X2 [Gouania willdenowi]
MEEKPQWGLSKSSSGPGDSEPDASLMEHTERRSEEAEAARDLSPDNSVEPILALFKTKRFFVLRPGTLNQAIKEVKAMVNKEVDGSVHSIWLMTEVDHWNNEKERLVLITDNSLLVIKYDFIMFMCEQIQRIPLNYIDRIFHGTFSFPSASLLQGLDGGTVERDVQHLRPSRGSVGAASLLCLADGPRPLPGRVGRHVQLTTIQTIAVGCDWVGAFATGSLPAVATLLCVACFSSWWSGGWSLPWGGLGLPI